MSSRTILIAAACLGLATTRARACESDPFLFQLPGETEADAHKRSTEVSDDMAVVRHHNREQAAFENATSVFLGRIVSRGAGSFEPGRPGPSSIVRPLTLLKGNLPSGDQKLVYEVQPGACQDYGDGEAAISDVGELVVVFSGLAKSPMRPRGIDSFRVMSIRTIPLLDLLREYGKDLED